VTSQKHSKRKPAQGQLLLRRSHEGSCLVSSRWSLSLGYCEVSQLLRQLLHLLHQMMSQELVERPQHNLVEPFDTQQSFYQDSPTVGYNQAQYSPNSLSPVSESGKRLVVSVSIPNLSAISITHSFAFRSQRRAAPSPLQTSTTATSPLSSVTPTRSTFERSRLDNLPTPSPQEQRLPKDRLDDLLASERSFYRSEDSSADSIHSPKTR
jgi:hypothetical protein